MQQNSTQINAVVWGQKNCKYCEMACKLLASKSIYVDERKIDNVTWTMDDLQKAVPGARTVPQIFIDGVYVGNYNDLVGYLK